MSLRLALSPTFSSDLWAAAMDGSGQSYVFERPAELCGGVLWAGFQRGDDGTTVPTVSFGYNLYDACDGSVDIVLVENTRVLPS